MRLRPVVVSVLAWCAGAGVAATVGLLALSIVGGDLTTETRQPLPGGFALAGPPTPATPSPTTPRPSGRPTPATGSPTVVEPAKTQRPIERTGTSAGGTVTAICSDGRAHLAYWTPAQGFRAHDVIRGPAEVARLTFEGAREEVKVSVVCADGVPEFTARGEREDDHEPTGHD